MKKDIRIAYLTSTDPLNRRSWSGIHSFMLDHLKKEFQDVQIIGPLNGGIAEITGKIKNRLLHRLTGKRYDYSHSLSLSRTYAREAGNKLKEIKPDIIVAPTASTVVANLDTAIPVILLSDSVVANMIDYYESYTNLTGPSVKESLAIETKAISKAAACIYPSGWAADAAIRQHGADPQKIKVIPFGPNLHVIPTAEQALQEKKKDILKLLFLGVDWKRKGGPLVLDTLREIIKNGVSAELTVCGCTPENTGDLPVKVISFIDKNNSKGEELIRDLFLEHHFLFLPSMAECYGIVFVEAAACGCPSISRNTGGISGAVVQGINGYLLPPDAGAKDYAERILNSFNGNYNELQKSSRRLYEETHNWNLWAAEVKKIARQLV